MRLIFDQENFRDQLERLESFISFELVSGRKNYIQTVDFRYMNGMYDGSLRSAREQFAGLNVRVWNTEDIQRRELAWSILFPDHDPLPELISGDLIKPTIYKLTKK